LSKKDNRRSDKDLKPSQTENETVKRAAGLLAAYLDLWEPFVEGNDVRFNVSESSLN
jgi:hypothetical protein